MLSALCKYYEKDAFLDPTGNIQRPFFSLLINMPVLNMLLFATLLLCLMDGFDIYVYGSVPICYHASFHLSQ